MCRIAGIVSEKFDTRLTKAMVGTMCNAMEHGGPDDAGIFEDCEQQLVFGHRRLSIIDLSSNGHQPMADVAQRAWITFNGEIYNYREIKNTLQQLGISFISGTDTEVILQAYLYWGAASFNMLKGMFAFALYDTIKAEVYLVRDSSGIKPLYYSAEQGQLIFASEIKAFKAAGIADEKEERWPVWLLAYGHIPEPFTTLKNVFSLPKGHYLRWQKNKGQAIFSYVETITNTIISDSYLAQSEIHKSLKDAVKRQLISDAPIGVFLSGGIDSSILSLLANEEQAQLLKTISIYFDEKLYDERQYQNAVLKTTGAQNFKHLVKEEDFAAHFPAIMKAMDMPTTDGINSWFISKYAHENGLKAVLSGVGADELFGGYPSFARIHLIKYLRKIPKALLRKANVIEINNYKRLAYLAYTHPMADYLFLRGLFAPADIAKIVDIDEGQLIDILFGTNAFPALGAYDGLHASWFETNLYMQNQLLRDTDVMSMSHGLEVRVPFLDEDFRQLTQRVDPKLKFTNIQPKKILIDSFKAALPEIVLNRPKMGFSFPLQQWMKNNNSIADEGYYNGQFAKKNIKKFKTGHSHWSKAFALYQIQGHV